MRMFKKLYQIADGGGGNNPPVKDDNAEAVKNLAFERDNAKAEANKLKQRLAELEKSLPTDEQKQKWASLEEQQAKAEEERQRKAGEWDAMRQQLNERHESQIKAREKMIAEAEAKAAKTNTELNDTLVGLQFAAAAKLFGPGAKTVLTPDIAQAYFANRVEVQHDEKTGSRKVVVKDHNGVTIIDEKTGNPKAFEDAMEELIEAHPQKNSLLRGSGKSGSGSPGGGTGVDTIDLTQTRVTAAQLAANPKLKDQIRDHAAKAGGLQIGPAFDRYRKRA